MMAVLECIRLHGPRGGYHETMHPLPLLFFAPRSSALHAGVTTYEPMYRWRLQVVLAAVVLRPRRRAMQCLDRSCRCDVSVYTIDG